MKSNQLTEIIMKFVFLIFACFSIVAVIVICAFMFANGFPAMAKIGLEISFSEQNGVPDKTFSAYSL